MIAGFCYRYLEKAGVRVPESVSIIGIDNIQISKYLGLTTLAQSRSELGKAAFSAVKILMEGIPVNTLLLRPRLIVRSSTAKAPKAPKPTAKEV
jgi:DNA-binding LacI/PurR family transcriptional regulator